MKVSIFRYRTLAENRNTEKESWVYISVRDSGNNLLSTFFLLCVMPFLGRDYVNLPDKMEQSQTITTAIHLRNNAGFHCLISLSNLEVSLLETAQLLPTSSLKLYHEDKWPSQNPEPFPECIVPSSLTLLALLSRTSDNSRDNSKASHSIILPCYKTTQKNLPQMSNLKEYY